MDTYKVNAKNTHYGKALAISAVTIAVVLIGYAIFNDDSIVVKPSEIALVKYGDLKETTVVLGSLQSVKAEIITSKVDGRVVSIDVRPGAVVETNDTLLVLQNEKLLDELRSAKVKFTQAQSTSVIEKSQAIAGIDAARFEMLRAENQENFAKKEFNAKSKAYDMGILSRMQMEETRAKWDLVRMESSAAESRYKNESVVGRARLNAEIAKDALARQELNKIEKDVRSLNLTSTAAGVVGQIFVEIGTAVIVGTPLLKFIDQSAGYYVRLNVPEESSSVISTGARVEVELSESKLTGVVSQIYPFAKDGYVTVEVALKQKQAKNYSADKAVTAKIYNDVLKNITYVKIPPNIKPNSTGVVYVLGTDAKTAQYRRVNFGGISGSNIIIQHGLKEGETILLNKFDGNPRKLKVKVLVND